MVNHSLELVDPFQHLHIGVIAEIHVLAARVPRVERMEADSAQCFFW